jgi:GDP-L-fucose synthase
MNKTEKCFLAGHKGMVGSAILRKLKKNQTFEIITANKNQLDLVSQKQVSDFFESHRPSVVILAAAKVGGIKMNRNNQAQFLYDNLMIQNNVLHAAANNGVKKFLYLGSSCIYPRESPQPISESCLMQGPLEPTNEGYALAKISGLKLAQFYSKSFGMKCICPMPCNLYGPNDNFDKNNSHVLSGLVRRFVDAVDENRDNEKLWGTGKAKREFLHVDDAADAFLLLLDNWESDSHINVGSGRDITIKELAQKIAFYAGYKGEISWNNSPDEDGMPQKLLDVTKLNKLHFEPKISLKEGIKQMILIYKKLKNETKKL